MNKQNGKLVRFIEFICFDTRLIEDNSNEIITRFKDTAIYDLDAAVKEKVYKKYIIHFTENGEKKQQAFCVNFDDMRFAVPIIEAVIEDRICQRAKSHNDEVRALRERIAYLESAIYRKNVPLWRRIKNAILVHQDDRRWF